MSTAEPLMKSSDILARAQEIILERTWTQKKSIDQRTGAVCGSGAVYVAAGGEIHRIDRRYTIRPASNATTYRYTRCLNFLPLCETLTRYNDAPGREMSEVLDVLHQGQLRAKEAGD